MGQSFRGLHLVKMLPFREVLLACLLGLSVEAIKPLYHHPVYNMPVYAHQPLGYSIPSKTQVQKITPYAGNGDKGVHFWSMLCQVAHRPVAKLWDAFDADTDGLISFNEMNGASSCAYDGPTRECYWVAVMAPEILRKSISDGPVVGDGPGEDAAEMILYMLMDQVRPLFYKWDLNNDNVLDMDEFFNFAHSMFDAAEFYHISTRGYYDSDGNTDPLNPDEGTFPRRWTVITQDEWDCKQNSDFTGLDPENCDPDNTQTLIEDMDGNNGDGELTLWEWFDVLANFQRKAKNSNHFEDYCKSFTPYSTEEFGGFYEPVNGGENGGENGGDTELPAA